MPTDILLAALACLAAEFYIQRHDKRMRAIAVPIDIWNTAFRNRNIQISEWVQ